jgi:hypothetical protein
VDDLPRPPHSAPCTICVVKGGSQNMWKNLNGKHIEKQNPCFPTRFPQVFSTFRPQLPLKTIIIFKNFSDPAPFMKMVYAKYLFCGLILFCNQRGDLERSDLMKQDISTLQKSGHFYLGLTRCVDLLSLIRYY